MHRTRSVDYGVVLDGEIWLELEDGAQTLLTPGDTVVQIAGRHAWHNRTIEPRRWHSSSRVLMSERLDARMTFSLATTRVNGSPTPVLVLDGRHYRIADLAPEVCQRPS
jgi:hypothetical protein